MEAQNKAVAELAPNGFNHTDTEEVNGAVRYNFENDGDVFQVTVDNSGPLFNASVYGATDGRNRSIECHNESDVSRAATRMARMFN